MSMKAFFFFFFLKSLFVYQTPVYQTVMALNKPPFHNFLFHNIGLSAVLCCVHSIHQVPRPAYIGSPCLF